MKLQDVELYVCPATREPLRLESAVEVAGEIDHGVLVSDSGIKYEIRDGIPDLTYPSQLATEDEHARKFYDDRVAAYDENLHLTFQTHREDEAKVRNLFVDALELTPSSRVLEISCGTGR